MAIANMTVRNGMGYAITICQPASTKSQCSGELRQVDPARARVTVGGKASLETALSVSEIQYGDSLNVR